MEFQFCSVLDESVMQLDSQEIFDHHYKPNEAANTKSFEELEILSEEAGVRIEVVEESEHLCDCSRSAEEADS